MLDSHSRRPVYLNLLQIRLPLPGVISFAHRISGALMFLSIPFLLYLFGLSLSNPGGFERVQFLIINPWLAPLVIVLVWSLCHHLIAGFRHLFMDVDLLVSKRSGYISAIIAGSLGILLAIGLLLEIYL